MMSIEAQPGRKFQVTVKRAITRATALKTLERLFMKDKAIAAPLALRSSYFKDVPKRRGGRIWTKRPNKIHTSIITGARATILATAQHARDLGSVAEFVEVATV